MPTASEWPEWCDPKKPQRPFVQIIHINDKYWITVNNLFWGLNELCKYCSLNTKINTHTEQNKSWLIYPQAPQFLIWKPVVQMQQTTGSCRLFALVFAFVLCGGVRPEDCKFNEKKHETKTVKSFAKQNSSSINKLAPPPIVRKRQGQFPLLFLRQPLDHSLVALVSTTCQRSFREQVKRWPCLQSHLHLSCAPLPKQQEEGLIVILVAPEHISACGSCYCYSCCQGSHGSCRGTGGPQ